MPVPLSLSDAEYAAVQAATSPIHPLQRGDFLKALAAELEMHPTIGLFGRADAGDHIEETVANRCACEEAGILLDYPR